MGSNKLPSFTPAIMQTEKKNLLPTVIEFDCPYSRLELFTFSDKRKYDLTRALVNKKYTKDEAEQIVNHIDKVLEEVKPRYDLQEDISYVEFVSIKFDILCRISFFDVKKDDARKNSNYTNILKLNIPCPAIASSGPLLN